MAKWYYLVDGQEIGPVEPADLKRLANSGQLKPTDKVRRADMPKWNFGKDVAGLFAAHTQTASKPVSKPDQFAAPNSAQIRELRKVGANLSLVESFMWPWRRYTNRWARAAVFVACCAIVIPISKWGGRFLGTQVAEAERQTASRQPRDKASLIVADTAQPRAEPPAAVAPDDRDLFARGETLIFDTAGNTKANGIRVRISYPRTWKEEEGDGPATIQRLISNGGQGNKAVLIQTWALPKPFDRELTETEKEAYLTAVTDDVWKQAFGGKTHVKFHKIGKLNDEICAMAELETIIDQDGLQIGMKALVFVMLRNGFQLMLNCYVQGDASRGVSAIWQEYDATKPLFTEIIKSCVFMDEPRASLDLRP